MKKIQLLLLSLICMHTLLNCMENTQLVVAEQSDYMAYTTVWNSLVRDYHDYAKEQLVAYETSPIDIKAIHAMEKVMTGARPYCINGIDQPRDQDNNNFLHKAVEKKGIATVEWLDINNRANLVMQRNNNSKTAFEVCLNQLLPTVDNTDNSKDTSAKILTTLSRLINRLPKMFVYDKYRKECLKNLVAVELQYKKNQPNNFNFNYLVAQILSYLSPMKERTAQHFSALYQTAIDTTDGDTFTHVLVDQASPDELFTWIKDKRLSFVANKAGAVPQSIALEKFRHFIQNPSCISADPETFNKRRCCLFMLLNYCKLRDGNTDPIFDQCCEKHAITSNML